MSRERVVYLPDRDYKLPNIDLLTYIFESNQQCPSNESTILNVEAAQPSNCITKSQTRTYTKQIAYQLRHEFGIGANGPGKDVVVSVSSGQILLPVLFYGVIAAGGVYSAASSVATYQELARQVKQGKARLIVASEDCADVAVKAAMEAGASPDRVLILKSTGGQRVLQQQMHGERKRNLLESSDKLLDWEVVTDEKELEERAICLLYSSGTTGPPKGVRVSHRNIVSEGVIPYYGVQEYIRRRQVSEPSFRFEYRTVAHLPAAHVAGVQGYFVNPAIFGGVVYWMPKFDFVKFLEYNKKFRVTIFFTVPPIYILITKSPLVTDQFRSLVQTISGAAPMGPKTAAAVEAKLGVPISQTWGLSETTGSITLMPWDEHDATGSVSPLMANSRMRIVDEDENDVEEGEEGELCVQGPTVTKGYWDDEETTKQAFTKDGIWFKTGDVGLRKDKKFYIVDRKKELIKYKGLQVAPAELEALLVSHPLILDAAVIGIPDPDGSGNELPRAYVAVEASNKDRIPESAIKNLVKKNMAQHKQLRGGVVYLDAVPRSPSGKILRKELKAMAKREGSSKL